MSIAYNGYYPHEPLIIEGQPNGTYTVIEGNRRLCALQLLLDKDLRARLRATDIPNIDAIDQNRREEISMVPCVESTRRDAWRYLGFKHVNGPAMWGAYAKAQYIAFVHNTYRVPLEEIAKQIGDYSNTVERQYRGLMVVEQAEEEDVFSRDTIAKKKFHFNYIYTALENEHFRRFLGIKDKGRGLKRPVPQTHIKRLGELLTWLYGKDDTPSLIVSQNPDLGILANTLSDPGGVKALRAGLPLSVAHDISLGDEQIFRRALHDTKTSLQRALGTLSTGFTETNGDLLQMAITIENLAADLVDGMQTNARVTRRPNRVRRKT